MLGSSVPANRRTRIAEQLAEPNVFVGMGGSGCVCPHLHTTESDIDQVLRGARPRDGEGSDVDRIAATRSRWERHLAPL